MLLLLLLFYLFISLADFCLGDANENKSLNMEVASIYVIDSDRRVLKTVFTYKHINATTFSSSMCARFVHLQKKNISMDLYGVTVRIAHIEIT